MENPTQAPLGEGGAGPAANSGLAELSPGHSTGSRPPSHSRKMEKPSAREADLSGLAGMFSNVWGLQQMSRETLKLINPEQRKVKCCHFPSVQIGRRSAQQCIGLVKDLGASDLTAQSCFLLSCDARCQTPGRQLAASQRRSMRTLCTATEASERPMVSALPPRTLALPADQVEGVALS